MARSGVPQAIASLERATSYTKSLERLRRHYISRLVQPKYLVKTIMRSCKMALLNPHLDDIEAEITYLLIRVQLSKSEVRL